MFRSCLIAALLFSTQSAFAQDQTQTQDPNALNRDFTFERFAVGGKKSKFAAFYSLNIDCSAAAWQEVRVVKQPENGEAKLVEMLTQINYTAPNVRVKCNGKSTKAKALEYTPTKGYVGNDVIEVETISESGEHHTYTYNITVK
jgi:hypothetical protein